jgi:glutamyl-tRNA synthetase
MYDPYFFEAINQVQPFDPRYDREKIIEVLQAYLEKPGLELSEEAWFENLKALALDHGFAPKPKEYKKNPDQWLGHVGDFAEIIRIAVSAKKSTPNFFHILQILGYNRIAQRISHTISLL